MTCVFCAIARGEAPAHVVYSDDEVAAFLDTHPIRPGHILVIPRAHHPYFTDMPPDLAAHVTRVGQRLAQAVRKLHDVRRVAFLFTGADIAHAHAHVFPIHQATDVTSRRYIAEADLTFRAPPAATQDELAGVAGFVRANATFD